MNRKSIKNKSLMALLLCTIPLFTACVNEIESEDSSGTVPIKFSTKVSNTNTRVTDTAFEKGDKVGLYAMLPSTSITEKRYIDNIWLECGENEIFTPEKTVFYPAGDATLDFISYYPYLKTGIPIGKSTIPVSTQTDQSKDGNRVLSDFLIASEEDIASSEDAVELQYKHKFTKIKIIITPGAGEDVTKMYNAKPRIIATGFNTKAEYDTKTDTFINLTEEADIIPHGEWNITSGNLTGKEFIIIPQKISPDIQSFTMEWNGKVYTCPMPEITMQGSTQCQIKITAMQATSHTLTGIASKVDDWVNGENKDTDNKGGITTIRLAALSFSQSNVYRVYHGGKPIAEVCKEYLKSDQITSKAIVVYPVKENEQSDLSHGTVLQLQDEKEAINGGIISWDINKNTFNYTEGSSQIINKVYLNAEGAILLEKPENPISIDIVSHTIKDIRNGNTCEYPIVKVGTQYWMGEDLHATAYRDGTTLSKQTNLGKGESYFKPKDYEAYFYNGEAVLKNNLAPTGWKIPNTNDWKSLKAYIENDASLIKAGDWEASTEGKPACPASNLTDFAVYPVGMWGDGQHLLKNKLVGYWTLNNEDGSSSIPEQTVFFTGSSNLCDSGNTLVSKASYYKALSIRCIKE